MPIVYNGLELFFYFCFFIRFLTLFTISILFVVYLRFKSLIQKNFITFRYAAVQFSKNPDKYIKYKPHEIKACLNKLFDDSA